MSASLLSVALHRYCKYVWRLENLGEIYPVCLDLEYEDFCNKLLKKKVNPHNPKKKITGLMFYTFETKSAEGWYSNRIMRSRMVRSYFENVFPSVTVHLSSDLGKITESFIDGMRRLAATIINFPAKNELPPNWAEIGSEFIEILNNAKIALVKLQGSVSQLNNGLHNNSAEMDLVDVFEKLSTIYTSQSVHCTTLGHEKYRELYESVKNRSNSDGDIGGILRNNYLIETQHDIAGLVANPFEKNDKVNILIIEDMPGNIKEDINKIVNFFPNGSEFYITSEKPEKGWQQFLSDDFWTGMNEENATLQLHKITNKLIDGVEINLFKDSKLIFDYVIVDLLLGAHNRGNEIINRLVDFRNYINRENSPNKQSYFDILVFSLSEDSYDIIRALSEGALFYIPKKLPYLLPAVIAQLEPRRQILAKTAHLFKRTQKSRNFGRLYRLPEIIKRRLLTEPFLDLSNLLEPAGKLNAKPSGEKEMKINLVKDQARKWIEKMPKADLHCHLGGSIDAETAFFLSLNMLVKNDANDLYIELLKRQFVKQIQLIDSVLWNGESILDLFQKLKLLLTIIVKFEIDSSRIIQIKISEINEYLKNYPIKLSATISEINSIPEEKFEQFFKVVECYIVAGKLKGKKPTEIIIEKEYFSIITSLLKNEDPKVKIINPVNVFTVLIGLVDNIQKKSIKSFWTNINHNIKEVYSEKAVPKTFFMELNLIKITKTNTALYSLLKTALISELDKLNKNKTQNNTLEEFISARKRKTTSLAQYLGGNEFMGSDQLQKKENILAALYYVIQRNVTDNVRYLEIRLSPDGYIKEGLTLQEAVETLLQSTDLITLYLYRKGKFIRVNYIFTIKRHKDPKEAALECSAAILNRQREKKYYDIHPPISVINIGIIQYQWKPSTVVGIDLAGLERGNPARNFVNDFYPLFKTSSFITVHAGEEDTAQSIWEAIYLLHATRIGHGLTLRENKELTELLKNLQVCIEMNPISNSLTNKDITDHYPIYEYLLNGHNITINTDNQAVSDCKLSDEYVEAAELFQRHRDNTEKQWISKWEILRIIKNGFGSSFLDREEKRQLLRAVESEIYQILINEYSG
jgi:adenosine deaminase